MFDKLVESDTAGAEFKNRGRYFMVSSVVVGILFLTAVVYSLYATEVGLGNGNFEITELISPIAPDAPEPEPPRQQTPANQSSSTPRNIDSNMARVDEPTIAPTSVSTIKNTEPSRGLERFDPLRPQSFGDGGPGTAGRIETTGSSSGNIDVETDEPAVRTTELPPPVVKKPPVIKSEGVINGKATYLPVPVYPAPAKAVGAMGEVKVQVTIDEEGRVISAKAVSGHPLLRQAAETSARNAKFSTTYLSRVPVKVTGVIMYNFKSP